MSLPTSLLVSTLLMPLLSHVVSPWQVAEARLQTASAKAQSQELSTQLAEIKAAKTALEVGWGGLMG